MDEIIGKLIRLYYEHQTDEVWCVNIFGIPHMEFVPFKLKDLGTNDLLIGQKIIDTVKNVISPFELFPQSSHPDGSSEYPSMTVHYIHSIPNDNVIVSLRMYQFKPMKQYFNDEKLVFGIGERPVFERLFDSNCIEEFNFNLLEMTFISSSTFKRQPLGQIIQVNSFILTSLQSQGYFALNKR